VFTKILVAVDGSENSEKALDTAINLAAELKDQLLIVTAVDISHLYGEGVVVPQESMDSVYSKAHEILNKAKSKAENEKVSCITEVLEGEPSRSILDYSTTNGAGLIVTGSRGLSAAKRIFLGSVSTRIVQESSIPVLVVK
jgi:nucleotide-binding universal stress UspA family protein